MQSIEESTGAAQAVMSELEAISLQDGVRAALLWKDGKLLWRGPDVAESFYIWSMTKSFTSLCTGLLVDDGKIDIDAPAVEWLPELAKDYPTVTLRHFLTFTSGLATADDDPFVLGPPRYAPGEMFHYSFESDWIALALTRVAGKPLAELFRERIAAPIGMDATQWSWGNYGKRDGLLINGGSGALDAGLTMTPEQVLRFGQLMLKRGNWDGQQLISEAWLDESQTSQPTTLRPPWMAEDGWYRDWLPGTYGLHWWCNGTMADGEMLWPSAPENVFAAQGNLNQICLIVPEWKIILVRMGSDSVIDMRGYDRVLSEMKELL